MIGFDATATFTPTDEFQVVPDGAALPPGCEIVMDFATGQNKARWAQPAPSNGDGHDAASSPAPQLTADLPTAAQVPADLLAYPNWVAWRVKPGDKPGDRPGKVLVNPHTGRDADSTDPATWGTFDQARARAIRDGLAGVGFVFTDSPIAGIDLDHCRNADTGTVEPWAAEIISEQDSYTEVSPSGTGVHVFVKGDKPGKSCKKKRADGGEIELYDTGRFFTFTGQRVDGCPDTIHERQDQLTALYRRVFGDPTPAASPLPDPSSPVDLEDCELLDRMRSSKHGPDIEALISGDTSKHGNDDSAADLALCNYLAFWTGKDAARMDRLFRTSGLMRAKWDTKRGDSTYGADTIRKAIEDTAEVYTPARSVTPASSPSSTPATGTVAAKTTRRRRWTDLGNAERLADRHGDKLRHVREWGWMVWDGARWARDPGLAMRLAKECARSIYHEAGDDDDEERRKALAKWAAASESAAKLSAMLSLAESELGIAVKADLFDTDPMLLNCQNGTVDLRTGQLRPHRPGDYLTAVIPVGYDSNADCPQFKKFLKTIMGDKTALIAFMQRAFGYTVTGETIERVLFILHGCGRNGKTTLLKVLLGLLGDYALRTPTETLLVKRGDSIPNDVARLKGARYVCASETDEGRRLSEALIKDLTGGDTLSARFMRGEWFDFTPACKVWLGTNHKPTIKGTDKAIWDRIRLIPFDVRIADDQVDKHLPDKLKAEWPGILKWAVDGCLAWQRDGLGTPAEVTEATAAYQAEMDVLAAFLGDCCIQEPTAEASAKALYAAYKLWCDVSGEKPVKQIAFGQALAERGFQPKRKAGTGQRLWQGIGFLHLLTNKPEGVTHFDPVTHCDADSSINTSKNSIHGTIPEPVSQCVTPAKCVTPDDTDDREEVTF